MSLAHHLSTKRLPELTKKTAKLLILNGAHVNAVDGYDATPAEAGDAAVTRLLLDANADLHVSNS